MTDNTPESQLPREDRGRINRTRANKEWKLIEQVLLAGQKEQRRARIWGYVFKFAVLAYLIIVFLVINASSSWEESPKVKSPHVGLVDIQGIILEGSEANADRLSQGLRKAFEAENTQGIIIRINSPGGSPVQSGLVYREIRRLKTLHSDKKVYAVITDVGASGGYYVAAAADEIYADPASLVGSIGVTSPGFGFSDLIQNLGIERRVYTAGENKAFLDPFLPRDEAQVAFFNNILSDVHQQFIDAVKQGRGDRLHNEETVFSGLIWSGRQALGLGLIDGLASAGQVAREIIGVEEVVDYTPRVNPFERFAGQLGVKMVDRAAALIGYDGLQLR